MLAVPLAFALLWKIRRDVRRFTHQRTHSSGVHPAPAERADAVPLQIVMDEARATPRADEARALMARMKRARRRAARWYLLAASLAALLAVRGVTDQPYPAFIVVQQLWPVVLMFGVVAIASVRARVAFFASVALAIVAGMVVIVIVTHPEGFHSGSQPVYLVAPTLLVFLVENAWLKTLAPLVLLVAILPFVGSAIGERVLHVTNGSVPLAFVTAGLCGIFGLARAYERKYFSDLSFHLAFIWLSFRVTYMLQGQDVGWGFASVLLYAALTRLTLPLVRREARRHPSADVLVLRVFGAPGRTQRFFDTFGALWRYGGPIHLIAGVDSAVANLDLPEAVRFLTGRFRTLYVSSDEDRAARLAALDCAPDPDGRYRVNDFFCFEDTWKRTFTELLDRAHAVLVDLRGFRPQNTGVAFELGRLLGHRSFATFVLVIDRKTDEAYLREMLARLWRQVDPAAPNANVQQPAVHVLRKPRARELVAALCDAAVAGGWRDVPQEAAVTSLAVTGT